MKLNNRFRIFNFSCSENVP